MITVAYCIGDTVELCGGRVVPQCYIVLQRDVVSTYAIFEKMIDEHDLSDDDDATKLESSRLVMSKPL